MEILIHVYTYIRSSTNISLTYKSTNRDQTVELLIKSIALAPAYFIHSECTVQHVTLPLSTIYNFTTENSIYPQLSNIKSKMNCFGCTWLQQGQMFGGKSVGWREIDVYHVNLKERCLAHVTVVYMYMAYKQWHYHRDNRRQCSVAKTTG